MSQELTEKVARALASYGGFRDRDLESIARDVLAVVRKDLEEHRRLLNSQYEVIDISRENGLLDIIIDRLSASPLGEQ